MNEYTEKKCLKCGQELRFPKNIGGMLMACPSCGNKFQSDFKLGGIRRSGQKGIVKNLFELPSEMVLRICRYFKGG
jgi:DNA-directed RNA polymerase subunit RPC12/RpoP